MAKTSGKEEKEGRRKGIQGRGMRRWGGGLMRGSCRRRIQDGIERYGSDKGRGRQKG